MSKVYISNPIRKEVINRANGLCEYCQFPAQFAYQPFCVDHIIPISKNGLNSIDNLAHSCQNCNGHKHNKIVGIDPTNKEEVPLYNPRLDDWAKHFIWNENYSIVVGISLVGRATVNTLKMNEPKYVELRQLLFELGIYPP